MKIKEFKTEIKKLIKKGSESDHYFLVWFSKKDDKYHTITKMDTGDALILIKELAKRYCNPEVVAQMLNDIAKEEE